MRLEQAQQIEYWEVYVLLLVRSAAKEPECRGIGPESGDCLWSVASMEIASRRESRCVAMVARHQRIVRWVAPKLGDTREVFGQELGCECE